MGDQRVRGTAPPPLSSSVEKLGLPSWIGSILDWFGGSPDDVSSAVTPLDLPAAPLVTLFKKAVPVDKAIRTAASPRAKLNAQAAKAAGLAEIMVPDVKARKAAGNVRWHDLRQALSRDPNITPEEMSDVLSVATNNSRTLAHMGEFFKPGTEGHLGRSEEGLFGLFEQPGRPYINTRPGTEDIGRIGLFPENMPPVGERASTLVPETFGHELGHGAQRLWDPEMARKSAAELEQLTQDLIASGQTPAQARYAARRGTSYELGAQRTGANQARRVQAALEKMLASGPLTVSEPFKVNK